jgi:hypothetical protein
MIRLISTQFCPTRNSAGWQLCVCQAHSQLLGLASESTVFSVASLLTCTVTAIDLQLHVSIFIIKIKRYYQSCTFPSELRQTHGRPGIETPQCSSIVIWIPCFAQRPLCRLPHSSSLLYRESCPLSVLFQNLDSCVHIYQADRGQGCLSLCFESPTTTRILSKLLIIESNLNLSIRILVC